VAVTRLLLALALVAGAAPALAQSGPGASGRDPCTYAAKSSVPIDIAGPGTIGLVPPLGSASIYVCGVNVTLSAAPFNSATFEYGTGAACANPTALSGDIGFSNPISWSSNSPQSATSFSSGADFTLFTAPSGTGLCVVTTGGAAAFVSGFLTYVQQ